VAGRARSQYVVEQRGYENVPLMTTNTGEIENFLCNTDVIETSEVLRFDEK